MFFLFCSLINFDISSLKLLVVDLREEKYVSSLSSLFLFCVEFENKNSKLLNQANNKKIQYS